MIFLGTGSAAGIPNPFCNCKICENARHVKGKEIRTRSSFLLDDNILFDFSPDYLSQAVNANVDLSKIQHVFFTHTHDDHCNHALLWERFISFKKLDFPLHFYFVEDAFEYMNDFYNHSKVINNLDLRINEHNGIGHQLSFYETIQIKDYAITPFKARHSGIYEKIGANYLIEQKGHKLYYALDSGYFYEETFEHLKNQHLSILIEECSTVDFHKLDKESSHMDINIALENLEHLYQIKAIDEHTQVYFSHIGEGIYNHEELSNYIENLATPYSIRIAYDTLTIHF